MRRICALIAIVLLAGCTQQPQPAPQQLVAAPTSGGASQSVTRLSQLKGDVDTITTPPTDGQALVWETSVDPDKWIPGTVSGGVDASAASDGEVYTADGLGGADFEAPGAASGITTPDGETTVTASDRYNVRDYGASGLDSIWHCTTSTSGTTTVTTKTAGGVATNHDFQVGHGVVLLGAGATTSLSTPDATKGAVTPQGTPGSTTYEFTVAAYDGLGGRTAASSAIQTTTGAATLNLTNYLRLKLPCPYGAVSLALYGSGTSSRKLINVIDVTKKFTTGGGEGLGDSFSAIADSGGAAVLTVPSGHGMIGGDVIHINATSSGDNAYDGAYTIASVTATTITLGASTYGASGDASGRWEQGWVQIDYHGATPPLHEGKGMPDTELRNVDWVASTVQPRGDYIIDSSDRIWRSISAQADRDTDSVEPSWNTSLTAVFNDGNHTRKRCLDFVPVAEPATAGRQALLTTVATVPTASTFTTTDAASADIASTTFTTVAHNDALAFREAIAAIEASGKGGVLYADGIHEFFLPGPSDTDYWSDVSSGTAVTRAVLSLRSGVSGKNTPVTSIELAPSACVRAYYMQCDGGLHDIATGSSRHTLNFLHMGGNGVVVRGGAFEWNPYSGGIAEHYTDVSFGQSSSWAFDQGNSNGSNLGTKPQNTLIADTRIDWPSIWSTGGVVDTATFTGRGLTLRNVKLHYGGGDGDQTLSTTGGDFNVLDCEIWNTRRLGSHGLYLGVNYRRMRVSNTTFRDISTSNSFPIQARGSSGDGYVLNTIISNCFFTANCQPLIIGDQTSGNQVHNLSLVNCHGAALTFAECRRLSVLGGTYRYITCPEDSEQVRISDLSAEYMAITPSDLGRKISINNVDCQGAIRLGNLSESRLDGFEIIDAHLKSTNYASYLYEWVATGSNNEYYCRLRSTGGDPSISSPTAVRIREKVTIAAGTLGSLANDTWYYGDPDGGGAIAYNTLVVKIGDDQRYDPDAGPYGAIWSCSVSGNDINVVLSSTLENCTIRNGVIQSNWDVETPFLQRSGSSMPTLTNVQFDRITFEGAGFPVSNNGAWRIMDFNTTAPGARWDNVRFRECEWLHPTFDTSTVCSILRINMAKGGDIWFERCRMPGWGSGYEITNAYGNVHLIDNEVQTNQMTVTVNTTTDAATAANTLYTASLLDSAVTSQPVVIEVSDLTLPTSTPQVAVGTLYWMRQSTGDTYPTKADADANTNAINYTAAGTGMILKFLNAAMTTTRSSNEYMGDIAGRAIWGVCRGNRWRGSPMATYAQITGDQNQYTLIPLLNHHRLSSDASRTINGIAAVGLSQPGREDTIFNVGAQDIVLADSSGSAAAVDRISLSANHTITADNSATLMYEPESQTWRVKSATE